MADDTRANAPTPEPAPGPARASQPARGGRAARREPKLRWECRCGDPPILLARYDPGGQVQIKVRDRFYIASGCVYATCPRCGAQHILDLRPDELTGSAPATPGTEPSWR
jgi:hypothetical protein